MKNGRATAYRSNAYLTQCLLRIMFVNQIKRGLAARLRRPT